MLDKDCDINYESLGDGPPVVLIHGMGASLRQWDYLMPQLAARGFRAYALDLQGHGDSAKPRNLEKYHIEVLYQQLRCWIDHLHLEEPALFVGHSLGGYLSLLYALRYPDNVHALVLADPFYSPLQLTPIIRFLRIQPGTGIRFLKQLPAWTFDMVFRWAEKLKQPPSTPLQRQLFYDYKRTTPLVLNIPRTIKDLTPQLHNVTHPVLVVWGSKDKTLAPASFPKIVEALPEAESFIFPGCGHVPHLTQPPTFNQRVLDFANQSFNCL
jgi:4,5:9,10-diseco-3-hydroxy-5,9,17-trioxoandrosta-1(10),2-diene-4-oate hydrolase